MDTVGTDAQAEERAREEALTHLNGFVTYIAPLSLEEFLEQWLEEDEGDENERFEW